MSDPVRYRLIPARGLGNRPAHVWGDVDAARSAAVEMAADLGMPVVVSEAEPDGTVRYLFTVADSVRRSVRRAA